MSGRVVAHIVPSGWLMVIVRSAESWDDSSRETQHMEANELHRRAQSVFASVLAQVTDDDLDRATPCGEWNVAALVQHLLDGHRWVVGMGGGEPPTADDTDRQAAFATLSGAAQAMFDAPDGMTRTFDLPFGTVSGSVFASIRSGDAYAHAWDLATAIGASTDLDPEVGEAVHAATAPFLSPALRGDGKPFGDEQPCGPDRPMADRLAAFLGRTVS
jgi:uncharacterized protein (TIGR03086 family)